MLNKHKLNALINTTIKSGLAVAIYLLFLREMDDNGIVQMTRKQICSELNASMMGTGYAINVLLDGNLISIKKAGRNHVYQIIP